MIGAWTRFGEGPMPQEGEAIVFVEFSTPAQRLLGEAVGRVTPAIFRAGSLMTQDGMSMPIPYGSEWTSLPHPASKA